MADRTSLVDIYCPCCGRRLSEPFVRFGGPVAYRHRVHNRGHSCLARLIVLPDQARAVHIPDHISFSVALREVLRQEVVR